MQTYVHVKAHSCMLTKALDEADDTMPTPFSRNFHDEDRQRHSGKMERNRWMEEEWIFTQYEKQPPWSTIKRTFKRKGPKKTVVFIIPLFTTPPRQTLQTSQ